MWAPMIFAFSQESGAVAGLVLKLADILEVSAIGTGIHERARTARLTEMN